MFVCVFGSRSLGPVSVIYVSQVDPQLGVLGKMSDDTEISNVIPACAMLRRRLSGVCKVAGGKACLPATLLCIHHSCR